MTSESDNRWWGMRFAGAVAIVCAIVLGAPLGDMALTAAAGEPPMPAELAGIDAGALLADGDVKAALAGIEELADSEAKGDVPAWFLDEIGLLPGARNVRSSGPVVGCVVDGESAEVFGQLRLDMLRRGWRCVPLGGVDGATFVKDGGRCTWALMTCTQVGSATSVVFRLNAPWN